MNLLVSRYASLLSQVALPSTGVARRLWSLYRLRRVGLFMSTPSSEIASATAVPDAARDDFAEHCAEKRSAYRYRELRDSEERTALAISLIQDTEQVKRTRNSERYVTRSLLGYEESDEARAERAEAEVAALKDKVAELRERNGKLEGKVEVFERLFSIVEARPKQ